MTGHIRIITSVVLLPALLVECEGRVGIPVEVKHQTVTYLLVVRALIVHVVQICLTFCFKCLHGQNFCIVGLRKKFRPFSSEFWVVVGKFFDKLVIEKRHVVDEAVADNRFLSSCQIFYDLTESPFFLK